MSTCISIQSAIGYSAYYHIVITMEPVASLHSAIIGCGPSGCFLLNLLRQSQAKAKLIAVDNDQSSLEMATADQSIIVKPGEQPIFDIGSFEVAFVVFDPSEGLALKYAQAVASRVTAEGAYVFAVALNKPGYSFPETEVVRSFGGLAVVDAAWVLQKRGDSDDERALQIAFNFAAHMLTFFAGAIDSGELSIPLLKEITSSGVCGFAASHVSEAEALFAMTMSRIERPKVKAGFVFIDSATDDVLSRRIFLRTIAGFDREANIHMLRIGGMAPFKVVAMLVH